MTLLAIGRPTPAPDTVEPTGCAPGGELRALTGLRIVAALWVVAFHFHFTELPGVTDVSALLGPLITEGALGVDLFFVLSGFVIAHTYLDKLGPRWRPRATARFVWARAGRMWPAYLLVFHLFGIWLLVRATYGSGTDIAFQAVQPELSWGRWLQQLVMVQMWDRPFLDGASWVGPTWSISAEWLAYLLFPLTALVFFRLRRLPAAVLGFGALLAMSPMVASFLVVGTPYYPFSWLVRVLCGFSAGVLTLLAVRRMSGTARVRRVSSATATLAGLGIVGGLLAADVAGAGLVGVLTLLFPVLVGALALADRGPVRWLGSAPMVHGGRMSYALYLVHIPMFEILWLALQNGAGGRFGGLLVPGSVSAHVAALIVLVATLPAAHLLYAFVEQPARGWMRRLPNLRRRRDVGAVVPAQADPVEVGPAHAEGPVDSTRARIDPPTLRVSVRPSAPRLAVERPDPPVLPASVPRQSGRPDPVPALVRLHTAREAGHGDDGLGDGLAGNLMAAARLRSVGGVPDGPGYDRSERILRDLRAMATPPGPGPADDRPDPGDTAPHEAVRRGGPARRGAGAAARPPWEPHRSRTVRTDQQPSPGARQRGDADRGRRGRVRPGPASPGARAASQERLTPPSTTGAPVTRPSGCGRQDGVTGQRIARPGHPAPRPNGSMSSLPPAPLPAPPEPDRAAVGWYLRVARHELGRGPYLDVGGIDGALLAGLARFGPASALAASEEEAAALRAGAPGCPVVVDLRLLPAPARALTAVGLLDRLPDDELDSDLGPGGWWRALEPGGRALVVAADADGRARELLGPRWPAPPVPRGHARVREVLVAAGFGVLREGSDGLCRGPYGRVPSVLDPRTAPAVAQRSSGRLTMAPGSGESAVLVVRRPY